MQNLAMTSLEKVPTVARLALGAVFVLFGLNGFLHFLPQPDDASVFDSWDPANVSPMIAYLGTSVCPFTGEVFFVQGDIVCRYQPHSIAERIMNNGERWTVERLIKEGPKLTSAGDRRGGPGELARATG
jgi:hypothetical protein